MNIVHCYTLMLSCVMSFNNYSNSSKCSDMEAALDCVHSEPTSCDVLLLKHEMARLGFTSPEEEETSAVLEHSGQTSQQREVNGTAGSISRERQSHKKAPRTKALQNKKEQKAAVEEADERTTRRGEQPDMELYYRMYVILKLIDQAKQEYQDDCTSKSSGAAIAGERSQVSRSARNGVTSVLTTKPMSSGALTIGLVVLVWPNSA